MDSLPVHVQHNAMVTALAKPGATIAAEMTAEDAHLLHMAVGVAGEAGELVEALLLRRALHLPIDLEHVTEELGDGEFYLTGLRQGLGVSRIGLLLSYRPSAEVSQLIQTAAGPDALSCIYVVQANHLLDAIKKKVIYRKKLDLERVLVLLANIDEVLTAVRLSLNISYDQTLEHNINKLLTGDKARFKDGSYSDEAAQARVDKEGAQQ